MLGGMMTTYKGSFTNLKLVREGREALSFSEEEDKELQFSPEENMIRWNEVAAVKYQAVDVLLSSTILNIIKGMLVKLNETAELTEQHFTLYEKFVLNE